MSKLTDELWAKRLADAARDGKLNISYMDLPCLETSRVLEIVGKIPNLVELDLRSNDLTDLPPELATLRHLRNVKLTYNKFETIPVAASYTHLPLPPRSPALTPAVSDILQQHA